MQHTSGIIRCSRTRRSQRTRASAGSSTSTCRRCFLHAANRQRKKTSNYGTSDMPVPRISRVRSDRGIDTKASSAVSTAPPRLDLRSKAGHALKFTQLARFLLFSNTNTKKHLHIFAGLGSCSFVVRMLWAHFCWRRNPCSDRAQSDLDLPHMYRQLVKAQR